MLTDHEPFCSRARSRVAGSAVWMGGTLFPLDTLWIPHDGCSIDGDILSHIGMPCAWLSYEGQTGHRLNDSVVYE